MELDPPQIMNSFGGSFQAFGDPDMVMQEPGGGLRAMAHSRIFGDSRNANEFEGFRFHHGGAGEFVEPPEFRNNFGGGLFD